MKKIIMLIILGIMMISCGKEMNWYKAPYAKETIMAEGEIDYDAIHSNKEVSMGGARLHRGFTDKEVVYSYMSRTMNNGHLVEVIAANDFDFTEINKLLKEYDYVVVPFTEEQYNETINSIDIKNNPKLKNETDLYMFALVPKKYIK